MEPNHLRLITHCPLCRASYQDAMIRFCNDQGSAKVYHCTCSACAHSMIAVVMENSGWSSSIGMVTDLGVEDVQRLQAQKNLSADDCVQFHDLLTSQSRELCQSFSKKNVA